MTTRRARTRFCQCLAIAAAFCQTLAIAARAGQIEDCPWLYPYGISAKFATDAELATTNLAKGQLVANQEDFSDLRIGDGETPGGVPVGRAALARYNMLHAWGGATADEIKAFLALSIADQRPDLAPYATKAALAAASNALAAADAAAIASHEARMHHDTYFCRWDQTNISSTATNWIPTNNWPSTDIYLDINFAGLSTTPTNINIGIRGGWAPPEDRHLVIAFLRGTVASGAEPGGISIGNKQVTGFSGSSFRRIYNLRWLAAHQVWVIDNYSATTANNIYTASGNLSKTTLPNDVFLPVFDEEEPAAALSLSPALPPGLSPSLDIQPDAPALEPEEDESLSDL